MLAVLTLMIAPSERPAFEPYRACVAHLLSTSAAAQVIPEDLVAPLIDACADPREDFRSRYRDYLETLARHPDGQAMDETVQAEIDAFLNRALAAYLRHDQTGTWPPGWP